jgi:hypothetical protein
MRDPPRRRAAIDQPCRAVRAPTRQPPIDRALAHPGGLGRRRDRPARKHHPIDNPLPPDRTERCSSVNLHLGLLELRCLAALSLQRGPDVLLTKVPRNYS